MESQPDEVILHVGTNDVDNKEATEIVEGIAEIGQIIKQASSKTEIIISQIVNRANVSRNFSNFIVSSPQDTKQGILYVMTVAFQFQNTGQVSLRIALLWLVVRRITVGIKINYKDIPCFKLLLVNFALASFLLYINKHIYV